MQEKNKKTLLKIIFLSAIALMITSIFSPIISFDYSDVLKEYGYNNPDWYWTAEGSLFVDKLSVFTFSEEMNKKVSEFYRYTILALFRIEIGEKGDWTEITDYNIDKETLFSKGLTSMVGFVFSSILLFLFIYFCYSYIKYNYNYNRKNKYLLFLGFVTLILVIFKIIGVYMNIDYHDTQNIGYTNFLTFGYGFYLACIGIFLFFISYFIQYYFLNFSNNKKSDKLKI